MKIDYEHNKNIHTLSGARLALKEILSGLTFTSLLDVGCGTGTWLKAALELGLDDIFGIDGVDINPADLLIPSERFKCHDLTTSLKLDRKYDLVLCFEVAEHLEEESGRLLIKTITDHSDNILFSAACPGQEGQNHINCQWPIYWQRIFNEQGYVCDDAVRWRIWTIQEIEPWYRQNMFLATRDMEKAGLEERIASVIHPEMIKWLKLTGEIKTLIQNHY
jgi:SAM-dependent methyltransferase